MNAPLHAMAFHPARTAMAGFRLEDEGCCIVRGLAAASTIARIEADLETDFRETPFCQGPFYGERTKRFGGCSPARGRSRRSFWTRSFWHLPTGSSVPGATPSS